MSGIYRGPNGSATADALNIDGDKGDLTISNSGLEWSINPDTVDFSKMQNISTDVLLGRASVGSGNIEEITCTAAGRALLDDVNAASQRTTLGLGNAATATIGTEVLAYDANLQSFVNTFTLPTADSTNGFVLTTNGAGTLQLTAPGGISDADYGDIYVSTGGTVWTIDNDAVTYAKIQNVSASDKLLGRSTSGAGDIEEIACTSAGRALLDDVDASAQRTTLGLGSLATLNTVTNAELDNQYIDDLSIVTFDPANDYVPISDASDGGNKKKALLPAQEVLRNYIQGLVFSTAGSSSTFSVTSGQCADSTNTLLINFSSLSKTTSSWAVGSGNGGLDTGTIANNTWYTPYIIRRPDTGVVDLIFSTNTTSPTLPANYTQFRKLDGMPLRTNGSGQWTKFIHVDNEVMWDVPVLDVNVAGSVGSSTNYTLTVPVGVRVTAKFNAGVSVAGAFFTYFHSPDIASAAPSGSVAPLGTVAIDSSGTSVIKTEVITNTSSQISARMSFSTTLRIATLGWITDRGRNA